MKIAKRVLICMLALALLVSCLVIASFADDAVTEPGGEGGEIVPVLPDYADVLKYYDPVYSTLYSNEDFEDGEYNGSFYYTPASEGETVGGISVGSKKYFSIKLGHLLNPAAQADAVYKVQFGGASINKLIAGAVVRGTYDKVSGMVCDTCSFTTLDTNRSLCPNCSVDLRLVKSKAPTASVSVSDNLGVGAPLVKLNFETGDVLYFNGAGYSVFEDYKVYAGNEYYVQVVCDSTKYSFSITGCTDNTDSTVVTHSSNDLSAPLYSFTSVSFGAAYADDVRNAEIAVDNVFVQAGVDNRTVDVDVAAGTADGLKLIDSMLKSAEYSAEVKLDVVAVYDTLTSTYLSKLNAIIASDTEGAVSAELANVEASVTAFFAAELERVVSTINTDDLYPARLSHIVDNEVYSSRISAILNGVDIDSADEIIKGAAESLKAFNKEKSALAALAAETERFISFISDAIANAPDTFTSDDYSTMLSFIESVRSEFEVDGVKTYSVSYPGVNETNGVYTVLESKFNTYLSKSVIFCENVHIAAKASGAAGDELADEEYSASLAAYDIAKGVDFSNPTFPGMEEALAIFATLNDLDEMSVIANRFIDNVATAEQATYIFMMEEMLDTAEQDIDAVELRYPGVANAVARYHALRLDISNRKMAADEYIAAVKALEGKAGDELIAAIENALALQEAGNIMGYDGITEANIALNHAYSSEQLKLAYASKFVRLVDSINDAKTLEERYVAISLAEQTKGFADDKYDGVTKASEDLVIAMSRYNADVNAINESYVEVVEDAGAFSVAATELSKIMKLVVSAIKTIVD